MNSQFSTDPKISEILNMMKNVKQGTLLENGFYTIQYEIDQDIFKYREHEDIENNIKYQITQNIAESIFPKLEINTDTCANGNNNCIRYVTSFMLFKKQDMSSIIEYIIRNMSEGDLKRIRNKE